MRTFAPPQAPVKPFAESLHKSLGGVLIFAIFFGVFLCVCALANFYTDEKYVYHINLALLMCYFLGMSLTGFLIVWRHHDLIWTPLPWLFMYTGLHAGFGPMLFYFADDYTLTLLEASYAPDFSELFEVNLINYAGLIAVLFACYVASMFMKLPPSTDFKLSQDELAKTKIGCLIFLTIGAVLKYALWIPSAFGLINFVVPGFISTLMMSLYVGLLLLGYLAAEVGGSWRVTLVVLLIVELFLSFLTLSKLAFLYTPLVVILGIFFSRRKLRVLVVGAVSLAVVYIVIKPIVSHSRLFLERRDMRVGAGFKERINAVNYAVDSSNRDFERGDRASSDMGWWSRLCYAHYQAYTLDQYKAGFRGDTFRLLLYVFVPRLLYPDKPIMSFAGLEFNEMLHGHRSSFTALGVWAEGYWNGGWFFVLLVSIYLGILFAAVSWLSIRIVRRRDWLFFPLVLLGSKLGITTDAWFVANFVGSMVIFVGFAGVLFIVKVLLGGVLAVRGAAPSSST